MGMGLVGIFGFCKKNRHKYDLKDRDSKPRNKQNLEVGSRRPP